MMEEKSALGRGRAGRHHGVHRTPAAVLLEARPIRLILVAVDESAEGRARLDIAVHLAKATEAELVGVGLAPAGRSDPDQEADLLAGPRQAFRSATEDAAIDHYWRSACVAEIDKVVAWAKLADLVVLGRLCDHTPAIFRADHIGLECGRPLLILPPKLPTGTIGFNVMIAWDGSREAVRALHDAVPLMRDATRITIMECEGAHGGHNPDAAAAQDLLERHGFQAFSDVQIVESDSVADRLLDCAGQRGADLLVAGLYHHSRLREYVLGGISRDLLRRCPIPLLVSH
jgi:nucleotide-binding universal stress UspA family protein